MLLPKDALRELCRRHQIRQLVMLSGTHYHEDAPIDLIVEFEPEAKKALEFVDIQEELGRLLDHSVRLNTRRYHERFRLKGHEELLYENNTN